jgi:MYXO-CTERM domain-containing protein
VRRLAFTAVLVAIALILAAPARSAPVTFDLSGVVGSWSRSTDDNAAIPGPPTNGGTCAPGMASPPAPSGAGNDCFRYPFAEGSSVTIDITGDAVSLLSGSLIVDAVSSLVFNTIVITQHFETTLAGGATGTLVGNTILWSTPANMSTVGTINCTGVNCGLISMSEGAEYSLEPTFSSITNTITGPWLHLDSWLLDPSHTTIVASTIAVNRMSQVLELGNRRSGAFTFGPGQLAAYAGCYPTQPACPEPALAALALLGFGAVASARRRRTR